MASAAPRKNNVKKTLSLEEMVHGVLESDDNESLSEFIESESEIGDCKDEDGNQLFFCSCHHKHSCFKIRKILYMFMGAL